ncbi:MAG: NAD(P)-dependent oxidoreductase [Cyclobacteriaceae bacterium]
MYLGLKRILITGASGLIGSAIVDVLSKNFQVFAVARNDMWIDKNESRSLEFVNVDLSDRSCIDQILQIRPDIIIHCAASVPSIEKGDREQTFIENEQIDQNVFKCVGLLNCQLVYMSGTIVYGYLDNQKEINESQQLCPTSWYAKQKVEAEKIIKEQLNHGLILRINAPYGMGMKETVLMKFLKQAVRGDTILIHGSGSRCQDFTNTMDIAQFLNNMISKGCIPSGAYNISNGQPISMKSLAEKIVKITGQGSAIHTSGLSDNQEGYLASYSIEKARRELDWNPKIGLDEGIRILWKSLA